MKNILLLLLLFTGIVHGQIVNIPSTLLKEALTGNACVDLNGDGIGDADADTDNDGEIQFTEAEAVNGLYFGILLAGNGMTGLEAFTNLQHLQLSFISFTGVLDYTILPQLKTLNCSGTYASGINVTGLSQLEKLVCNDCLLSSLDVSTLTNLKILSCQENNLTTLDLTGLNNLESLYCSNNNLITLNLSTLSNLSILSCGFNQLTSLNVLSSTNLTELQCGYNNLTELDLHDLAILNRLTCSSNDLTLLNVDGCLALDIVFVDSNQFVSLDFSNTGVREFYCEDNPNLEYVNIKNGIFSQGTTGLSPPVLSFTNTAQLKFICVDENEAPLVTQAGVNPNLVSIATYCSFIPGGNFNTITGIIKFDDDNNGCDTGDLTRSYTKIKISDGTNEGSTYTNDQGIYNFYSLNGSFTITPELENLNYFNVSPTNAVITFPLLNNSTQTQNFCITANGIHPDLEVILTPIGVARPGFDSEYKIIYKNKGNQTQSGTITLTFDDLRTDFVSATPTVDTQLVNTLLWNFSNLQPFETRVVHLMLNVNTPLEIPAVNNGDLLDFSVAINSLVIDETPLDNEFHFSQTVVNSYDPNDKTCLEGNTITPESIGKYVHYNINFENIGTADAVNIVVKDFIDTTKFDINSLQLLYASHAVETKIISSKVEFIFENINLPSSIQNPIGGHGNVLFKIKTIESLVVGDEIANTASIFFDYNAPIQTNEARTTIATLSKDDFIKDETITVAPNPVRNTITVSSKNKLKSVLLFDVQGRLLQTVLEHNKTTTLDISNQANGIYFLKVITEVGGSVEKIVKE
jgi:uncharacterized repeat protein (TIGR01451 family)